MDLTQFQMVNRYERVQSMTPEEAARRLALVQKVMKEHQVNAALFFKLSESGMAWWLLGCSSKLPDCVLVTMDGAVVAIHYSSTDVAVGQFEPRITPGRSPIDQDLFGSITLRNAFDPADIAACYIGEKCPKIGVVNGGSMPLDVHQGLLQAFEGYETVELFGAIEVEKCIKSPLEMELCEESARMHTQFLQAVPSILRRGKTMREVCSELHALAMDMGSTGEDMCLMVHPFRHDLSEIEMDDSYPGYAFCDGDVVSILLETSGPGGMFTANARYYSFGEPCQELKERWAVAVAANDLVGELLKPGVSLHEIATQVNQFIREQGYYTDDCCYLHGMAYTMGETPIKADVAAGQMTTWSEDLPMQANMQTLAHPHVGFANGRVTDRDGMVRCIDTYYVTESGSRRATTMTRDITIL